MTDDNVTSYIRSLVNETTASFWTDADITLYKQLGMNVIQSTYFPYMKDRYKTFELKGTTADSDTFDTVISTDAWRITGIEIAETGARLRYITDNEYWKYAAWSPGEPNTWMFKGGVVKLIPTPSATTSELLRVWYLPIMDAVTEFPECLRPLIAIEAIISAKVRDENVSQDILFLHKRYSDAALIALTLDQMQEPIVMSDFELEEGYA